MDSLMQFMIGFLVVAPFFEFPAYVLMGLQGWQMNLFIFSLTSTSPIMVYIVAGATTLFSTVIGAHLLCLGMAAILTQNVPIQWLKQRNSAYGQLQREDVQFSLNFKFPGLQQLESN
jgi:hypothetical protein